MKEKRGWIPEEVYREITPRMPIPCVDLIIWHKGKVLLVWRSLPPAQNKWWVLGGRQKFWETREEAVMRLAKKEVGLDVEIIKYVGHVERRFTKGYFGKPCHCLSEVFLVKPVGKTAIQLDFQSAKFRWASRIPKHLGYYFENIPEILRLLEVGRRSK